ncbi:RelA/SpoT domain-containing protein [Paenibacillus spiritus]|uniref:RelA/SpoT domain-containing protein n=1 Tax=Paenibacillus spiritus TaxID=2496557 RepID=A0A5J5GD84_9BACL|nr:RelA/SpoT domain-containing protein [Paenibacillus spiritus]KAA9005898.1 RelA/SpoT domain-containing protein [Paenibacillus spiritus]
MEKVCGNLMDREDIIVPEVLLKPIEKKIIRELDKIGLFYRIFSRVKTNDSIEKKFSFKDYSDNKKMQDIIGVRIVLYFNDDIEICGKLISRIYEKLGESIDKPDSSTFKPTRTNIIYRLDDVTTREILPAIHGKFIDNTFELQLRTVFSEGWHEVEHDLRYKCEEEWRAYDEHSRTLNGLVATLETCDWSIMTLFSDLSYRNYRDSNIIPMMRNKFRLRFENTPLNADIETILLKDNKKLLKNLFRIDRNELLEKLSEIKIPIPLNFNNILYVCNYYYLSSGELQSITPTSITRILQK